MPRQSLSETSSITAYKEIGVMSDAIGRHQVVSDMQSNTTKGRKLEGKIIQSIIAACIFIACIGEANVRRAFKEICFLIKVLKNEFGRVFRTIEKLHVANAQATAGQMASACPVFWRGKASLQMKSGM
jgi:transcription initiation factor TFIIIB Brf1 subunit/transcription initiation factor TFIIB